MSAGEIAEVADADEASGQYMLAEAAQELACGERHDALLVAMGVVFPSKTYAVTIEAEQAPIADAARRDSVDFRKLIKKGVAKPTLAVLCRSNPFLARLSIAISEEHTWKKAQLKPIEHDVVWDADLSAAAAAVIVMGPITSPVPSRIT